MPPAAPSIAVVANPSSGRGKGGRLIPEVESLLRGLDADVEILISGGPEEPERLARKAAEAGASIVAALGGDGMVGLVANGVIGTGASMAVIPAGTGNDFATLLGLDPADPLAAARLLASPALRTIDAARVRTPEGERHFVNIGSVGFDSEVNAYANRIKLLKGKAKYAFATFAVLPRFKAGGFRLTLDGRTEEMAGMLIAVGNGVSYGGGMRITPEAVLDDGELDVCVIGDVSKVEFLRTFPKVFKGRHVEHPKVRTFRAREIQIEAERILQVFADGEHVGTIPATFTVVPGALSVVVPPSRGV